MKAILTLLAFALLSGSAFSLNIVDYRKRNRGLFGYDYVSSTYTGTINGSHNWIVECRDPGLISCRKALFSTGDLLDDIAMETADPFLDQMNDDIDKESEGGAVSGQWSKTLVTKDNDGKEVTVYIRARWETASDGSLEVHAEIEGKY
jgi:hypothetical protein